MYHQNFDRTLQHRMVHPTYGRGCENGCQSGGAWYNNSKDFIRGVKRVNNYAKDNKVISKIKGATDIIGLTPAIDLATGGIYSQGTNFATQYGYGPHRHHQVAGHRKKHGTGHRKGPGRPRKGPGRPRTH